MRASSTPCTGENSTAVTAIRERVARDHVARVLVVGAVADHEFHLVARLQPVDVRPVHPLCLAAAGALDVHDADDARRHPIEADVPPGLEQHGLAAFQQLAHQRRCVLLQQRLAAGHFHHAAVEALDLSEHPLSSIFRPS